MFYFKYFSDFMFGLSTTITKTKTENNYTKTEIRIKKTDLGGKSHKADKNIQQNYYFR